MPLARLILRHCAFESGRGDVRASGFLMDMNDLFQEFLTAALREALDAQGEADTASYIVKHSGKRLEVVALDLSGTLDEVLRRVDHVAARVRALREQARRALIAA